MQKKTHSSNGAKIAAVGAGLAVAAAAGYFFLGPKGKKHQHDTKVWAVRMKKEVIAKLKEAKKMSEPVYHDIIDSVAKEYAKKLKTGHGEVDALAKDLKKHWKTISKKAQ